MIKYFKSNIKHNAKLVISKLAENSLIYNSIKKQKIHVFLYHDVHPNPSEFSKHYNLNVHPDTFKKQLEFIHENYIIVSPNKLKSANTIDKPIALITFDDGLRGFFDYAIEILESFGCPSLIFLNGGPIQNEPFWSGLATYLCHHDPMFSEEPDNKNFLNTYGESSFLYLNKHQIENYFKGKNSLQEELYIKIKKFHGGFCNEDDLQKIDGHPLVFFGNHLYNHYNATNLKIDRLVFYFLKNAKYLSRYKNFLPGLFSYPFGQPKTCFTRSTNIALKKAGAKFIFSAISGGNKNFNQPIIQRIPMIGTLNNKNDISHHISKSIISTWPKRITNRSSFQIL